VLCFKEAFKLFQDGLPVSVILATLRRSQRFKEALSKKVELNIEFRIPNPVYKQESMLGKRNTEKAIHPFLKQ